jgi:Lon protease-like protein
MSDLLPLFPLSNVVLFPNVFLPLHVFEPRYLEMVADTLAGDRVIGMVLLQSGWEHDYAGRPPVYPVGCSGLISHFEKLADGRYNIILRGLERFRILEEHHGRAYRRAVVEPLPETPLGSAELLALTRDRSRLEALLAPRGARLGAEVVGASAMNDADLVNALSQYLDLEPLEKQALLERTCLRSRAESLVELLEMKIMMARTPGHSQVAH